MIHQREMKLQKLKDWINNLPEEYSELEVVVSENKYYGETGFYRHDNPVTSLTNNYQSGLISISID